jgi:hypothetical protein
VKEGRPSAIGYDRLRQAINVRLGDEIESRGGQSKVNTVAVDECIYGIFDAQAEDYASNARLWIAGGEAAASGTYTLSSYHPDDSPTFQNIILNENPSETGLPLFVRDSSVWFGDAPTSGARRICNLVRFSPPSGDTSLESGGYSFVPRFEASLSLHANTDLLSGVTYVGGNGIVLSWDGTTVLADSGSVFGGGVPRIIPFREDIYGAATHIFRKRSGGTWSSISMPVGITSFVPNDWAVYKDVLYLVGYDHVGGNNNVSKIISFDGTTLTDVRTPEAAGFDSDGVMSCAVAFGYLYFVCEFDGVGAVLGRYDGTTWTDSHKNMSAAGVGSAVSKAYDMLPYRGDLAMLIKESTPVATVRLIRSSGNATSSSWTLVKNIGEVTGNFSVGADWLMEF